MDNFSAYGVVDTNVIGFSTQSILTGTAFTVSTTANNGTVITINEDGLYALNATLASGTNLQVVISKNGSGAELTTTDPISTYGASLKRLAFAADNNVSADLHNVARTTLLAVNDTIRLQGNGSAPVTTQCVLAICKVSN
jgi:hypothetical protein